MVRVVNVKGLRTAEERAGVVYVGRPFAGWPGHELANPFRLTRDTPAERARCLARYRAWLLARPELHGELTALWWDTDDGRRPLGCWCHPQACHADVLAELLNQWPYEVVPTGRKEGGS